MKELSEASKRSGENIWQLPLDQIFHEQLYTSTCADLVNSVANAKGGSSLAAAFLEEFIPEDTEWIHLDIAGTSDTTSSSAYAQKGATGAMIETLVQLLCA